VLLKAFGGRNNTVVGLDMVGKQFKHLLKPGVGGGL
jgi:hypothetical protein